MMISPKMHRNKHRTKNMQTGIRLKNYRRNYDIQFLRCRSDKQ